MSDVANGRPQEGEYHPQHGVYVALAPERRAMEALEAQLADQDRLLAGLTEDQAALRYAPGKWSVRQVLAHVADAEQVFAYRALCIARGDTTPLPRFDENAYAELAPAEHVPLGALIERLRAVRGASFALFRPLDDAAWLRRGTASGQPVSVRGLAYVIAGHGRHHAAILRERYGLRGTRTAV
ncbi:MAG TPA: DinB family protein [Candidatus Eisenbacteria bacterium]|nr:DinB family protein [Candidatus Eisenbacteria bacterium]